MLRFKNLFCVHAVKIVIALIKLPDMVEAQPAIFAWAVIAMTRTVDRWGAKFSLFATSVDGTVLAIGFHTAMKAIGFLLLRIGGRQVFVRIWIEWGVRK
jgi:hypothetical protein